MFVSDNPLYPTRNTHACQAERVDRVFGGGEPRDRFAYPASEQNRLGKRGKRSGRGWNKWLRLIGLFGHGSEALALKTLEAIQRESSEEALHCFGTAHVFEVRANLLRQRIRLLTFLGIVVPATVGLAYMSFGASSWLTTPLVVLGSLLLILQLIGSIWSLVYRWDDSFAYSLESMSANRSFYERFKELASDTHNKEEANLFYQLPQSESQARSKEDEKQGATENEKRMGMRAGLRQLKRACAACNQVPTSMTPTDCNVCGNFSVPRF
jgi:mobilome CxxCx(11)CxxC protein